MSEILSRITERLAHPFPSLKQFHASQSGSGE
jgi:hypothetical protein